MSRIRIEYLPLATVARWPANPKEHDLVALRASVERFGFADPLAYDEGTGRLVEGHGRLALLEGMKAAGKPPPKRISVRGEDGEWLVPVIRGITFAGEDEARAYLLAHNRLVEKGGYDDALLVAALEEVRSKTEAGLKGTGFDDAALEKLQRGLAPMQAAPTGATPQEQLPGYEAGERKQLVFYFEAAQHADVEARLARLMVRESAESQAALFLRMLDAVAPEGSGPTA